MAVSQVILSSEGARGSASGETPGNVVISYSSTYRVKCSDASDAPSTVLNFFSQNAAYPWMGRVFNFGNGFDSSVICKSVNADYIDKSAGKFIVRCEFASLEGQGGGSATQGIDPTGKNTEDPLKWYDEIDITYANITEAAEKAVFRGFINGKGNAFFREGVERAITNSAGTPFVPPLEREVSIRVIRITTNSRECNLGAFAKFKNTVNSDAFSINKPIYGFRYEVRPNFAKFTDFACSFQIDNKVKYWRETKEVQIHPRGWRRVVLDRGIHRRLAAGDKDDAGNTISDSDVVDGWVPFTPVKDKDGYPITEPVPFDGNGKPLISPTLPHVYLIYSVDDEIPFGGIKW